MIGRAVFRVLLSALGLLLMLAARVSKRFRSQVSRDLVVEVRALDGLAHHYVFSGATQRMASRTGRFDGEAAVSLCFASSGLGFRTLIRTDGIGEVQRLMLAGRASHTGNAAYLLWFWGLTRMVLPHGHERPFRTGLPGALLAPDPASKVTGRIVREPATETLDPAWTDAHVAHTKMALIRSNHGEDVPLW